MNQPVDDSSAATLSQSILRMFLKALTVGFRVDKEQDDTWARRVSEPVTNPSHGPTRRWRPAERTWAKRTENTGANGTRVRNQMYPATFPHLTDSLRGKDVRFTEEWTQHERLWMMYAQVKIYKQMFMSQEKSSTDICCPAFKQLNLKQKLSSVSSGHNNTLDYNQCLKQRGHTV